MFTVELSSTSTNTIIAEECLAHPAANRQDSGSIPTAGTNLFFFLQLFLSMDERLHHNVPSLGLTVASYGMSNIRLTSLHLVSRRTNGSANAVRLSREQLLIEKLARSFGVYGVQKEALVLLPQLYLSL